MAKIENYFKINIKNILLKYKKPNFLYKHFPMLFVYVIRRVMHENTLNRYLDKYKYLQNTNFINALLKDFNITAVVNNANLVSKVEKYIFVCNHPLGAFDGILLISKLNALFGKTKIIGNEYLTYITPITDLFIPMQKDAKQQNLHSAKSLDSLLHSDANLVLFPAGQMSLEKGNVLYDTTWKKTFLLKAKDSDRKIVPIYFEGKNPRYYYIIIKIRKFLRIKFTLETLIYPTVFLNTKNKTFNITFSKPLSYEDIMQKNSNDLTKASQYVKDICYSMR